jgi:flavin-dependent dehydrogenase
VYDVIVVGAGPAGCTSAKRCAELGLATLLLEKLKLPRKKVCDGAMAPGAEALVEEVFGEIPRNVLSTPPRINGLIFYIPEPVKSTYSSAWFWRSKFDFWMTQKAIEAGAEVWDEATFTGLREDGPDYLAQVRLGRAPEEVRTRFIIGADGAASRVRKQILPDLRIPYLHQGHDRYEGELDLDRTWYHEFRHAEPKGLGLYSVYNKDEYFVIGYAAFEGRLNELIAESQVFLQKFGFVPDQKPAWSGRCVEPICAAELASYQFRPGKGNVLLAGDAGGFMMPVSMEGIGPGVRCGLLAAESIVLAMETGDKADQIYFEMVEPMVSLFREADEFEQRVMEAHEAGDNEKWLALLAQAESEDFYNNY